MEYSFYTDVYKGNSIEPGDFPRLIVRAQAQLEQYKRTYTISGEEDMAVCAMADVIYYFEQTPQSLSVGGISQTERPLELKTELYKAARIYLDIYRGVSC